MPLNSGSDNTGSKQKLQLWKPGQSGNPAGRPKGSKNKLSENFCAELHADFALHERAAIERVRIQEPAVYLKIIASLMPKEIYATTQSPMDSLSEEEAIELLAVLREARARTVNNFQRRV